jgi:hypothetical protein
LAEVAFGYDLVFFIHAYCAVGANHDAGPAAYAFVFVMFDFAGLGVFAHGAGEACCDAGCVFAVAALYRKGDWFLDFSADSCHWFGAFAVVCFDYVFCF